MTVERLESIRKIGVKEMYMQAQMESLPLNAPKRYEILDELSAMQNERDELYRWIDSIEDARMGNAIALRYVKQATWKEIVDLIPGFTQHGIRKAVQRFIWATEPEKHSKGVSAEAEEPESGKEFAK